MGSKISNTGFWSGDHAHTHHVHCPNLAEWIANYFSDDLDKPLYDFGCGMGDYLAHFHSKGFTNIQGFEGDPPVKRRFDNIVKQDLTKPFTVTPGNVLFLEVAEHVPAQFENQLLDNVVSACETNLVTSWAIVGQDGFGHVNCKDNDDVIKLFEDKGFIHLEDKTKEARSLNLDQAPWFYNTLFVFKRK